MIYDVAEVRQPIHSEFAGRNSIVVELFDVPKELQTEFDKWLNGNHLDAFASLPGVVRVRTWKQRKDDVPARFPYSRYVGKGNRMIWTDLEHDLDVRHFLADQQVLNAVTDSMSWDLRLNYVRRDACEHLLTRRPGHGN